MRPVTEVAAAVLLRPDGSFLLAQRPPGKPYPGYWEFPGGKVEAGESALEALGRELKEELDIEVTTAWPWITRVHTYQHATVRLRFFRVMGWQGDIRGMEGQAHVWQRIESLDVGPMLPANLPIFRALELPTTYAISNAGELGVTEFLALLEQALGAGLRLIQLREPEMHRSHLLAFGKELMRRCQAVGARVLVNGDVSLARELGADGVHLPTRALAAMSSRPDFNWVGASCHSPDELVRAIGLGCDLAVLGPVLPTLSHPERDAIGWSGFQEIAEDASIPVFGLGGLSPIDHSEAQRNGAHGIAMQRAAWRADVGSRPFASSFV